ncbi:MAG: hypothetical protein ACKVQA_15405 [Burkholderiales bacterium]
MPLTAIALPIVPVVASFEALAHQLVEFCAAQPREAPRQTPTEQQTGEDRKLEGLAQSRLRRHGAEHTQIEGVIGSRFEAYHLVIVPA